MENTTRLLQRHEDTLAQRPWAAVNANDPAMLQLPGLAHCHADLLLPGLAASPLCQSGMLPDVPEGIERAVMILPKSRERLHMLVSRLAQLGVPELWLVGPAKGGISGAITQLKALADNVEVLDSARHCKLVSCRLRPAAFDLGKYTSWFQVPVTDAGGTTALKVCSYPGVFSHGALDEGSALLLDGLVSLPARSPVLDMGCGAGVLTAWLAARGEKVTALDVSASAILATKETLGANGLSAEVVQSDLFSALAGNDHHRSGAVSRFARIVTNPPFHQGMDRTTAITRQLIEQAQRYLLPGGELVMVANLGLPYAQWLEGAFKQVEVLRESRRFRVYRAC